MRTPYPIDTVLFDMDGTLLDLAFDNIFWRQIVMQAWAQHNHTSIAQAEAQFTPLIKATEGTLAYYSLPYWSAQFGLDLAALTTQFSHLITLRPFAIEILQQLNQLGIACWLVTNAHSQVLDIKLAKLPIAQYFDVIVTSDLLNAPKEQQAYWQNLQARHPFDPQHALLVDDNEDVLASAAQFGIQSVLYVTQPDMRLPAKTHSCFPLLHQLLDIVPHISQSAAVQ